MGIIRTRLVLSNPSGGQAFGPVEVDALSPNIPMSLAKGLG